MADGNVDSFETLSGSGIVKLFAKDDKNVSLTIDVYKGNTSLCVWTGTGGKPWKMAIGPRVQAGIVTLLKMMRNEPRPLRQPIFLNEWIEADRKYKQKGCVGFGISDDLQLFIDVAASDLAGRHQFFVKQDGKYDFSNTSMSEKDMLGASIEYLLKAFDTHIPMAERLSSFPRKAGPGGGGGRGNFGGGGNKGNFGGGGNRQSQSQGTFSGGGDTENELYV